MRFRDAASLLALVVALQATLGAILYLFSSSSLDFFAVLVAVLVMVCVAGGIAAVLLIVSHRFARERALRVALMTLSEDERKVFEAILQVGGEARQDKLCKQLDMSKSKLSALVNNLERKGAITKTPYWKTNILRISEEFRK